MYPETLMGNENEYITINTIFSRLKEYPLRHEEKLEVKIYLSFQTFLATT